MDEIFSGVYRRGQQVLTLNASPGKTVYSEEIVEEGGEEYRTWLPNKSKLAAAIINGLETFPFSRDTSVLYLGSSTGTTPSHLSDVVTDGVVYCVEFSERVMREFLAVADERENLIPILEDARKPDEYGWIGEVDVVYEDVAQPDLVEIGIRNADKFLREDGWLMIAIKSQSIDVTEEPEKTYQYCADELEDAGYSVMEMVDLEPHEKDHAMIVARK